MKPLFLVFILLLFASCECEQLTPTIPETIPDPFQIVEEAELGFDGPFIIIEYFFNKPIDVESVVLGESLIIEGVVEPSFQVEFSTLSIFGDAEDCDFNTFPCTGSYTITFKGTGNSTIRSTSGQILDGDFNDVDGGDFMETVNF